MTFEAMESAMTAALYTALGQSVSYDSQGADTQTIYAIVDNGSESFGLETVAAEDVARARIKIADVAKPRRGDVLTLADGTAFIVDTVDRENNAEWVVTLTERDR